MCKDQQKKKKKINCGHFITFFFFTYSQSTLTVALYALWTFGSFFKHGLEESEMRVSFIKTQMTEIGCGSLFVLLNPDSHLLTRIINKKGG